MRILALVIATIGLCGCVAQNMNKGLDNLVGQDIHVAIARLGYPNGQSTILGDNVYYWGSSQNVALPFSNTSTTTGSVGGVPVYGTTTSTSWVPANFNCTIQIATDSNNIIKSYQWSGNMGGCSPYAKALTR